MKIDEILDLANKFADHIQPRPNVLYKNYDYGQQTKSEKENTKVGPGTGFFANMNNFKSVKDFINLDRKMKRKKRKNKLAFLILAKNENNLDLSDIPNDDLHKKEDGYKDGVEISEDHSIEGIPFINRIDPYPTYDSSLAQPIGYLFDNDTMKNSYEGIYSLQGSKIYQIVKLVEKYYDLIIK